MTLHDYRASQRLREESLVALLMAAMWKADSTNVGLLRQAFPTLWRELAERYNAPGGVLPTDSCERCRGNPAMGYLASEKQWLCHACAGGRTFMRMVTS